MFSFIGFLLGLFNGGFLSGIFGFIIGSFVDGFFFRKKVFRQRHNYSKNDFTEIILILTAAVMKANTQIKTSELNYVKTYLTNNYSLETAQRLLLKLKEILNKEYDINLVCEDLRNKATIHEKLYILQFLFGLAAADGTFNDAELKMIQNISDMMGVSRNDYESIKSMYLFSSQGGYSYYGGGFGYGGYNTGGYGSDGYGSYNHSSPQYNLDNDYKILEISSTATDEEVKKAYRALAKKYHPDKVNHLGEEIRKDAEGKFTILNQAYERIKKSRNMN